MSHSEKVSFDFAERGWQLVAAALEYNHLNTKEGFEAFDCDGDDKISATDLTTSCDLLELGLTSADVGNMISSSARDGVFITREEWENAILAYINNVEEILKARGLRLTLKSRNL